MILGAPQVIVIVLLVLRLGLHLGKDGEPLPGKYSFGAQLVAVCIWAALLWWGGFFG